jgi:hypothetical protein
MSCDTIKAKRFGLLSIVVATAAGCAVIVGADGYTVDGASTGGASSGSGGATGGVGGLGIGGVGASINVGGVGASINVGGLGVGGVGAGGTGNPPPDSGGKAGTGGVPPGSDAGRDAPLPTGAGETICSGNSMCPAGQYCLMTAFGAPGLCTYSCDTTPCDATHACVHSNNVTDNFPNSCVKKCPAGVTCPSSLLCVTISTGPVCLPTGWFDELGIGDDCFADVQCLSGSCSNKPGGWCTKPCGAADPLCAHDASSFPNRNDELNWCVSNAGSLSCVPGCDEFGVTTCGLYPGTMCKPITDILGSPQLACLP